LWLIIVFLIGWVLAWWYYSNKYRKEVDEWKTKYNDLENEHNTTIKAKKVRAPGVADAGAIASSFVDGVSKVDDSVKDDLTKVEGIGPKIRGLLNDDGIWSFRQLSQSPVDRLQGILNNAGPRFRIHNPGTWPEQARLAADGKWDELKKWQDNLKGGR
ncbi:MAG: hypothetical protein HKN90_09690, partial [Flavobacteriaceae bacterium]|nr:hypothetical protein [Flavobacteriaceae bacterium]